MSLSVEVWQLFIEIRRSNYVVLISNSSGALVGSLFYQWAFSQRGASSFRVPLACMFVPLCWISSMRSLWELPAVLTVGLISAISSLSLIQSVTSPAKRNITAVIWVAFACLPVVNARPIAGCILLASMPIVIWQTAQLRAQTLNKMVGSTTAMGFGLIVAINGYWYLTEAVTVWTNNQHLRLSELALSASLLSTCFVWDSVYRKK